MDEKTFARICYLCLMGHHGEGWEKAHPSYIDEKIHLLEAGFGAFNYLDSTNQQRVMDYFKEWNLELPKGFIQF